MTAEMMSAETARFVREHAGDDVRRLALKGAGQGGVDLPFALDQIAGRQTARRKLPLWAATEGIVYPPRLAMEQCSGEPAARYKARLAARLMAGGAPGAEAGCGGEGGRPAAGRLVDLTGGLGADFSFMARGFSHAVYVERQESLCRLARHNLPLLGLPGAEVVCADAASYLATMPPADVVFADPARRDSHGGRTYAIGDCTPDLAALRGLLLAKARFAVAKLSPMLDWRKAVSDLGGAVAEVHIVAVANECKDLLLVMTAGAAPPLRLACANDGRQEWFTVGGAEPQPPAVAPVEGEPSPPLFLCEPNAALMKAGCFGRLAARYGLAPLAANSHLFCSRRPAAGFPGRRFVVDAVAPMNKKELKKALSGVDRANIAVRNFPLSAPELRRRLKVSEGGSVYIFATTLANGSHRLLFCHRAPDGLHDGLLG